MYLSNRRDLDKARRINQDIEFEEVAFGCFFAFGPSAPFKELRMDGSLWLDVCYELQILLADHASRACANGASNNRGVRQRELAPAVAPQVFGRDESKQTNLPSA